MASEANSIASSIVVSDCGAIPASCLVINARDLNDLYRCLLLITVIYRKYYTSSPYSALTAPRSKEIVRLVAQWISKVVALSSAAQQALVFQNPGLKVSVGSYCEGVCLAAAKNARGFMSFFLIGGDHEAEQASGSFLALAPYLTVVHLDHRLGDR